MVTALNKTPKAQLQYKFSFLEKPSQEILSEDLLIDNFFPEKEANELAQLESYNKHLFRPNTYLHKWWARRSGTTFRYILKQLQGNKDISDFYKAGGLEGKIIFDPMMGGGTTLHEAIRMGASVIGVDIDPIPVLQAKASLTFLPSMQKESEYLRFFNRLKNKIGYLFKTACPNCHRDTEFQFMLYGLRRRCSCREVVFIDSVILREENHRNVIICPECRKIHIGSDHKCESLNDIKIFTKGTNKCDVCQNKFSDIKDVLYRDRYVPLVVVGNCQEHGIFFKDISDEDLELIKSARMLSRLLDFGDTRDFNIPHGPKSNALLNREINSFLELFSPRQLIYLNEVIKSLPEFKVENRLWIALLVSTSLDFNSLLCGYKGSGIRRPGAIRHVFSHHAYSFPYTALENNPINSGNTSGTLNRLFGDRIRKACLWSSSPIEIKVLKNSRKKVVIEGEIDGGDQAEDWVDLRTNDRKFIVMQGDAAEVSIPKNMVDFVVTDPPYFDSVQYSDLSNFFRVWLRRLLPQDADWQYNQLASAVSEGNGSGNQKYTEKITAIWQTCCRTLKKKNGRLIFTFHHWRHNAWAELTISLKRAEFFLVNRYVVHSENPISVHIMGLNALKHDCILVLSPDSDFSQTHQWSRPAEITKSDSSDFCRACGSALGWFLISDLSDEEIRSEWERLLEEN